MNPSQILHEAQQMHCSDLCKNSEGSVGYEGIYRQHFLQKFSLGEILDTFFV